MKTVCTKDNCTGWGSNLDIQEQRKGVSLILNQTLKGKELLEQSELELMDVELNRAIEHNHQLKHPSIKPNTREIFFDEIKNGKNFNANYIGDCASAIITVLINGKCGEAYNTANPDVRLTIAQLAEIIASAANRKVVFADPDDVDLAYRTPIAKQVLSSKKLENLGWSGVFSAEIGVKHTLDILLGK